MKVLLINGSPKKNGNTAIGLEEMVKIFEKEGIETEILQVGSKDVRGCIACGKCDEGCFSGARIVCGIEMTSDEVLKEVLLDKDYYKTDGGVTFSGGEPLAQPEFLEEIIDKCKNSGINCAIETSMIYFNEDIFKKLVGKSYSFVSLFHNTPYFSAFCGAITKLNVCSFEASMLYSGRVAGPQLPVPVPFV